MLYVGIDIAKNKHECCIVDSNGVPLEKTFAIKNSLDGFNYLIQRISNINPGGEEVEIGLESTGHYSENITSFLGHRYSVKVVNPILTAKWKKAQSLRKAKTDKIDALEIAQLLRYGTGFEPVKIIPHNIAELKSLSRYRAVLVRERSKKKIAVKRLVNITFPEIEKFFRNIHINSVYTMLEHYPGARYLATSHIKTLSELLRRASYGYYGEDMARQLRDAAKASIGNSSGAKAFELRSVIKRIEALDIEIGELDHKIETLLISINPPILSIPGIGFTMAASILGEVGDFSKFSSADKLVAFAGIAPTIYQSGEFTSSRSKMEKRGSKLLRATLFLAARSVANNDPNFAEYLFKKRKEGKHYFVAVSHTARKLVRLMYALETDNRMYEAR